MLTFVCMKTPSTETNSIGLETGQSEMLADKLNILLATYQVFYQNLRGFHWNISGPGFFELHLKFEELYTAANQAIDEVAERILTLEGTPLHTFADYLDRSLIGPAQHLRDAGATVSVTIENLTVLIGMEREILRISAEAGDEGTNALMSDYMRQQEKTTWMLRAYNA